MTHQLNELIMDFTSQSGHEPLTSRLIFFMWVNELFGYFPDLVGPHKDSVASIVQEACEGLHGMTH